MRYASIDIGTNSCRLMIASIVNEQLQVLHREVNTTRVGAGLAASGEISRKAAERTILCLQHFMQLIGQAGVENYRMVATSAVREASNRSWFAEQCRLHLHEEIEIISGEQEASLTYKGVQKGLNLGQSLLVADLGGGSTELIHSNAELFLCSLPLGAVRCAEVKPDDDQVMAVLEDIKGQQLCFRDAVLVFCGGTATSLVAMKYGMTKYDSQKVHGQRLDREEISLIYQKLRHMPLTSRQQVAGLQPERADVIVYGIQIMLSLMLALNKEWSVVSESDLLEGLIWEMYEKDAQKTIPG